MPTPYVSCTSRASSNAHPSHDELSDKVRTSLTRAGIRSVGGNNFFDANKNFLSAHVARKRLP